jgi:hypothetical protein
MAMTALLIAAMALLVSSAATAAPTSELEVSAGYSTEGVSAVAAQLRAFGDLRPGLRFFAEAASAGYTGAESDAFAAAYTYDKSWQVTESYLEKQLASGKTISGVRLGRYRTPFGISGRGDYAYTGFLRAPLVRYGDDHTLSNYWTEGGVDYFIGTPRLQMEASLGTPQEGRQSRRGGLDTLIRLQGYRGALIAGVSYLRTQPYRTGYGIHGTAHYTGVDGRWLRDGVQIRGEWIGGTPFHGASMHGWYVDAMLHKPVLGSATPLLRYERYHYSTPGERDSMSRWTTGVRVRLTRTLSGSVNVLQQHGLSGGPGPIVDVGLTHTTRF